MQVSASSFGQLINLNQRNAPLREVLREIRKQSGYDILSDTKAIMNNQKVTVVLNDASLEEALASTLNGLDLIYEITNKIVTIKKKEQPSMIDNIIARFQAVNVDVTGIVTDSLGLALPGASVTLKGTKTYHVLTDNSGKFKFSAIPTGTYKAIITYIGYQRMERTLDIAAGTPELRFMLLQATSELDQLQVIGYGTNTRRFSVGSVTTIDAAIIERQPVTNLLLALQGQVAGLVITPTNGAPGSVVKAQIRGQNSLARTPSRFAMKPLDEPLFIIDGVPFAPQNGSLGNLLTLGLSSNQENVIPGNGISAIGNINPADIESISVLRDADATSIYGSQGANGVILITTKKGKQGKPGLSITSNTGVNAVARPLEMMNSQQYLEMRRQSLLSSNVIITPATNVNSYPDLLVFDTVGRYTDWYDEFFNNSSGFTNVHASLSGGQQNSSFYLSGGYTTNSYNFPGDFADDRISLHSNYTYKSPNNKLTAQFGADYSYTKNTASSRPNVLNAMTMAPNFPALMDENGGLTWRYKSYGLSSFQQYSFLRQPANIQSHNLNDYLKVSFQVLPDLTLGTLVGYSRTNGSRYGARPLSVQEPGGLQSVASATFDNTVFQTINIEPQADYKLVIGRGELSLLLGGTYKKSLSNSDLLSGSRYANDDLLGSINGADPATIRAFASNSIYKYVAGFGRINYIYDRKYIATFSGRRDGSSNFGPGKQFGNFASAGLGWIFSEEKGVMETLPFLSFGKLSANYGTTGSDGVAPYLYQPFYAIDGQYSSFQGVRAYTPSNLFNSGYSWSLKKSLNTTLELGFLDDKIVTNATWYRSRMSDQLVPYTLPAITGFTSVTGNFPAVVENSGVELSVRSTNLSSGNLRWTTSFNISFGNNKLIAFPKLDTSPYTTVYEIGKSTTIFQGYRFKGLNETTGLYEFYKKDGTATSSVNSNHISAGGDAQPLFDLDPKYTGGMDNTLTYKGFSLSIFMQFAEQMTKNYLGGLYSFGVPGRMENLPAIMYDKWWKNPGDKTEMQRLATSFGSVSNVGTAFATSDAAYSNTYYVRLKTLAVSWSLPSQFIKVLGIRECRLNVNAQNLLTFTNYKLGDPESAGSIYNFPIQRTITGGLSINF
ncbi:SusC/RagA family TonB-linked outer membrane protein [Pedobacter psychroterrae]|nr:SusC/RagA family TonB-linked outer membrane protein [Pedobacter psychroterrae]